jgi:hypothetical protein
MPGWVKVYRWINEDEELQKRFARARELGHDAIAEECFDIADEQPPSDLLGRKDAAHVSWQKNRIWTRLQLLAKWNPKKYGDKQDINVTGQLDVAQTILAARKRSGG